MFKIFLWGLVWGSILGGIYFLLIWRILQKIPKLKLQTRWNITHFLFRVGLLLPLFYLFMDDSWVRLGGLVAGFFLSRLAISFFMNKRIPPV